MAARLEGTLAARILLVWVAGDRRSEPLSFQIAQQGQSPEKRRTPLPVVCSGSRRFSLAERFGVSRAHLPYDRSLSGRQEVKDKTPPTLSYAIMRGAIRLTATKSWIESILADERNYRAFMFDQVCLSGPFFRWVQMLLNHRSGTGLFLGYVNWVSVQNSLGRTESFLVEVEVIAGK